MSFASKPRGLKGSFALLNADFKSGLGEVLLGSKQETSSTPFDSYGETGSTWGERSPPAWKLCDLQTSSCNGGIKWVGRCTQYAEPKVNMKIDHFSQVTPKFTMG